MLEYEFVAQNLNFAINLFAAAVFFAAFWLYFDAWLGKITHLNKDILRWAGYLCLALSFLVLAGIIDNTDRFGILKSDNMELISRLLGVVGLGMIMAVEALSPLQKIPDHKKLGITTGSTVKAPGREKKNKQVASVFGISSVALAWLLPVGAAITGWLYWKRATKGLENHLKPLAVGFFVLAFYYLLALGELGQKSDNPQLVEFFREYGPIWIVEKISLLAAIVIIGKWVWNYLIKRFVSQLFMMITSLTLVIFLLTTLTFSYLQQNAINSNTISNLETSINVLDYAIKAKAAESAANSEAISKDSQIITATAAGDHRWLAELTDDILGKNSNTSLVITDTSGKVLQRAEDPDDFGGSVSSNTMVRRALVGLTTTSISSTPGVIHPVIQLTTTTPLRQNGLVVGTLSTGAELNNSFVDGIKTSTGLESSIYVGDRLSATTFLGSSNGTRLAGTKLDNQEIENTVIRNRAVFKGITQVAGVDYKSVYRPLQDADGAVAGMLMVGKSQDEINKLTNKAISDTFLSAIALMILSAVPALAGARYLARQIN